MLAQEEQSAPAAQGQELAAPAVAARRSGSSYLLVTVGLVVADALILLAAGWLAYHVRFFHGQSTSVTLLGLVQVTPRPTLYRKVVLLQAGATIALLWCFQAYARRELFYGLRQYAGALNAIALATLITVFGGYVVSRSESISRGFLLLAFGASAVLVCAERFVARRLLYALRGRRLLVERAVIVGTSEGAQMLEWGLRRQSGFGYEVAGFIDEQAPGTPIQAGLTVLGPISALPDLIARHAISRVFVASSALSHEATIAAIQLVALTEAAIAIAPDYLQVLATGARTVDLPGMTWVDLEKMRLTGANRLLKLLLDMSMALVLLVVLSPLLVALALLIRWRMGPGVLDRVPAVGAQGTVFHAYKFRTTERGEAMALRDPEVRERLARGLPVRAVPQVTTLGRVLRHYSYDELPQLFNVVRGEMSMVGPYKINPEHSALYGQRRLMVTAMKPGITGACQISGRGELTPEERALLDTDYVRNYSIWRDLAILARTFHAVARGRGAY